MFSLKDPKTLALYGVTLITITGSILALCVAYGALVSSRHPATQGATITVSGEGEVTAIPDIATISFTSREVAKTVPEAQKVVEGKIKSAKDNLGKLGVLDKDTKTISYTVNPRYETEGQIYCIMAPCPSPKQTITGYEVAQTVEVKVRKIDSAGQVLASLGELSITEISGPNFGIDDKDGIIAKAKDLAVKDAKVKAKATASSLGVDLGRIVGYSDNNGGIYYPMAASGMYARDAKVESVTLPAGEAVTKITVSITYELE